MQILHVKNNANMTELLKRAARDHINTDKKLYIYKAKSDAPYMYIAVVCDASAKPCEFDCIFKQNKFNEIEDVPKNQWPDMCNMLQDDYSKAFEAELDGINIRLWMYHSPTMKECIKSFSKEEIENEEFIAYTDYPEYKRREDVKKAERKEMEKKKCIIM